MYICKSAHRNKMRCVTLLTYMLLLQPFPRQEFGAEHMSMSLRELKLAPSGSLVLRKSEAPESCEFRSFLWKLVVTLIETYIRILKRIWFQFQHNHLLRKSTNPWGHWRQIQHQEQMEVIIRVTICQWTPLHLSHHRFLLCMTYLEHISGALGTN